MSDSLNAGLIGVCNAIWKDFFKRPLDSMPNNWHDAKDQLRDYFFSRAAWYDIYDFIEFVPQHDPLGATAGRPARFRIAVNEVLEREMSGYRFVDELIAPITDQVEIGEVETAIGGKNQAVAEQLQKALHFLSDRDNRDYRNSVKESISAVEGFVMSTLGTDKGTLGNLLGQLDAQASLHPAFKDALSKLYGYTSDEGGIRHALLEDSRAVSFEEAKFMLVLCSAFINYVRGTVST